VEQQHAFADQDMLEVVAKYVSIKAGSNKFNHIEIKRHFYLFYDERAIYHALNF